MKGFASLISFLLLSFVFASTSDAQEDTLQSRLNSFENLETPIQDEESTGIVSRVFYGVTGTVTGVFYWVLSFFWSSTPQVEPKQ